MKVDGPQNCVSNSRKVKVDGLRMRGWSKRDESGRSSKVRGYLKKMKVDGLRLRGRS